MTARRRNPWRGRWLALALLLQTFPGLHAMAAERTPAERPPNVVLIFADDLGNPHPPSPGRGIRSAGRVEE